MARLHRLALRRFAALAAVLALLGAAAGSARPALAQSVTQRIAAVVNDDVVTSQDLLDRLALAVATSGLPNDQETRQRLAPQVLRGFIDEKLQIQEARRLGLEVTEAEVDQAMDTIAKRNNTNRADLTRYLADVGLNPGTLRDQLRAQIAWIKVVSRELRPQIVVTQDQIDLALRRGVDGTVANVELLLTEILLPVYDRAQEASVVQDARGLVASIRGGADFSGLARQVSAAASAENGGDLGWVRAGAITPDLRDQILALDVGQISDPIVSPAGVHIIQVRDQRRPEDGAPVDRGQVRLRIEQEQLDRQAARYLRELRRDAFIDVRI
ncbi:MAG TPA: peptidylprolyl isomerase [Geminicoccaceae bacterium]|nr:peptidylprolyl isomerase [Geminicoccaceae bacterium]